MEAGALGLSWGLCMHRKIIINPELVDICSILSQYNGLLWLILWRGNINFFNRRVIYIAQENGIPLISHFKAAGRNNWTIKLIKHGPDRVSKSRGVM